MRRSKRSNKEQKVQSVAEWIRECGTSLQIPRRYRWLISQTDAEDIRQEAWANVIAAQGLNGRVTRGYLIVAMLREIWRRFRKPSARESNFEQLTDETITSLDGSPSLELARIELSADIVRLFPNPRHAAAVELTLLGFTSDEVAAMLSRGGHTTASAVRQWFRRTINPRLEEWLQAA